MQLSRLTQGPCGSGLLIQTAQQAGGVFLIRLCPGRPLGVLGQILADNHFFAGHQPGHFRCHEIEIARIVGAHHRLAQQHRFGQGQPKAFAAVQAGICVTAMDQGHGIRPAHHPVDQQHPALGLLGFQERQAIGVEGASCHLDHQQRIITCPERLAESPHQPQRIFPLHHTAHVKRKQHHKGALGQAKMGAVALGHRPQ